MTEGPARAATTPHLPWSLRDLSRLIWFEIVSVLAIIGCFIGARHTQGYDHRLYWIVGGIVALLIAGAGWVTWVLIGSRALRDRQRAFVAAAAPLVASAEPAPVVDGEARLVSGPGMTHYHRADCVFAQDRPVVVAPTSTHVRNGLTACKVCAP